MKVEILGTLKGGMALAKASPRSPRQGQGDGLCRSSSGDPVPGSKNKAKISTEFEEDSEYADLAEKVFQNFNAAFERDELMDEFDIVPVESKNNHSPVIHDAMEHKLALESWCVPYLYTHSYKIFLAIRRKQKCSLFLSGGTSPMGSRYGSLRASKLSETDRISHGLLLSRVLVMLNPDLAVAWNFRRDFVPITSQSMLEKELRLISLVWTRKPKCPEGFSYRRYVVSKAFQDGLILPETIHEWFLTEAISLEAPITRYSSNYHAWNYRLWLLQKILQDTKVPLDQKRLIQTSEIAYSDRWINTHVSDYCGHHYRQNLLLLKIKDSLTTSPREPNVSLLKKELDHNANRIELYEGHECLWNHRRAIMNMLILLLSETSDSQRILEIQDNEKKFTSLFLDLEEMPTEKESLSECTMLNASLCKKYVQWTNTHFSQWKWELPFPRDSQK